MPPASPAAIVYLVRHGETEENRQGVMQGQLDTPLNAAGVGQAYLTARVLKTKKFGRAHASDLKRAVKVCELLCGIHVPSPAVYCFREVAIFLINLLMCAKMR